MLYSLTGVLVGRRLDRLLVEVQGITLEIEAAPSLCSGASLGDTVTVFTQFTLPPEGQALVLYGFASAGERELFALLRRVRGVGSRIALDMIGSLGIEGVTSALMGKEERVFVAVKGVGKKLAQRLMIDLDQDRVLALRSDAPGEAPRGILGDASAALVALGFSAEEASAALDQAMRELGETEDLDVLVGAALRIRGAQA